MLAKRIGAFLLDILEVIVTAAAIFLFVYYLILQPHKIDGPSMLPTLEDKDYIFTDKVSYRFNEPQRGDIIVFKPPSNARQRGGKDYIKRIIALPGEEVAISSNSVYINGRLLAEKYIPDKTVTRDGSFLREGIVITVPEDKYFVLGDNRDFSSDSRTWGFVPKENITGKAWIMYWPLEKAGKFPEVNYEF